MAVEPGTAEVASQPGVAELAKIFLAARPDSSLRKELHHLLEVRQPNEGVVRVRFKKHMKIQFLKFGNT